MNRRTMIGGTATAGILGLSGCLGSLLDDLTSFEALQADVSRPVQSETGYEAASVEEIVNEETFEAAGQSETVVVTSYLSDYTKTIDMGLLGEQESATFAVLSTPKVEILDRTFNPIEEMSTEERIELIEDNYDDLGDIEHTEDGTVNILGQTVAESRFISQATIDGQPVDLVLHVTEAAERGDDFVVTIGAYPEPFESQEQPNIYELIGGVTPAEGESNRTDQDDTDENHDDDTADADNEDNDDGGETDEDTDDSDTDDSGGETLL